MWAGEEGQGGREHEAWPSLNALCQQLVLCTYDLGPWPVPCPGALGSVPITPPWTWGGTGGTLHYTAFWMSEYEDWIQEIWDHGDKFQVFWNLPFPSPQVTRASAVETLTHCMLLCNLSSLHTPFIPISVEGSFILLCQELIQAPRAQPNPCS